MISVVHNGSIARRFPLYQAVASRGFARLAPVEKDPARPKKPLSAYFLFAEKMRSQESARGKDFIQVTAKKWKGLAEADRAVYVNEAQKKLEQYAIAMAAYKASGKEAAWKRDPEMPVRPISGYLRFAAKYKVDNAAALKDLKVTEVSKKTGAAWKALSDADRKVFNDMYAKDKQVYDVANEKYKASGKLEQWKEMVGIAAVEKKAEEKKAKEAAKALAEKLKVKAKAQKAKDAEKAAKLKEKALAKAKALKEKEKMAKAQSKIQMATKDAQKAVDALKKKAAAAKLKEREVTKQLNKKLKALKATKKVVSKASSEKKGTKAASVKAAAAKTTKAAKTTTAAKTTKAAAAKTTKTTKSTK